MARLARFGREEFLGERFDYRPGDHFTVIGPTQQAGKTRLMFDVLGSIDTSWCSVPPVMAVAKPRDRTVREGVARLGYKVIDKWPPPPVLFGSKPPGYALWPKHLKNAPVETNNAHLYRSFEPALNECFWKGDSLFVADEMYYLCAVLGMEELMTRHWTQGMGMGSSLWSATQKPSGTQQGTIPSFMYNSSVHTFLSRDPDKRNRDRFSEIGGVDPRLVSDVTMSLAPFEFLYIHRAGPTMCVVGAA